MIPTKIKSIDDVILTLEQIIVESEINNDPLGYFAVLYQKVTIKIQEGIKTKYFDDGSRMEMLDVIFAKRYIAPFGLTQLMPGISLINCQARSR